MQEIEWYGTLLSTYFIGYGICEYSVEYEPPNPTRRAMRFVVESHLTI